VGQPGQAGKTETPKKDKYGKEKLPGEQLPEPDTPRPADGLAPGDMPYGPRTETTITGEVDLIGYRRDEDSKLAYSSNNMVLGLNSAAAVASGSGGYVQTKRGQAAGALPIQLSIPTAEIVPRIFKQSFAGTGRGTVDLIVVDRSTSMIVQILIALILCSACMLVARKYAGQTMVVATTLIIVLVALMPKPEMVLYAYISSAAYALGLGAILVGLAWLCARIGRALNKTRV
jgi:hypothetical protein